MIFQHPLMPPYGTPVPYQALYPPGGVYAHPAMAMVMCISFGFHLAIWFIIWIVFGILNSCDSKFQHLFGVNPGFLENENSLHPFPC